MMRREISLLLRCFTLLDDGWLSLLAEHHELVALVLFNDKGWEVCIENIS